MYNFVSLIYKMIPMWNPVDNDPQFSHFLRKCNPLHYSKTSIMIFRGMLGRWLGDEKFHCIATSSFIDRVALHFQGRQ